MRNSSGSCPGRHNLVRGRRVDDVPVDRLVSGDKVPVDGTVVKGATNVNEAVLTGESRPVEKRPERC